MLPGNQEKEEAQRLREDGDRDQNIVIEGAVRGRGSSGRREAAHPDGNHPQPKGSHPFIYGESAGLDSEGVYKICLFVLWYF